MKKIISTSFWLFTSLFIKVGRMLAHPQIVFYTVAWLMVLLVMGTIAQRYVGLYIAQNTFFYSWILWVGPIPLPGGLPVLGGLTAGLLAKLFMATPWRPTHAGIIITHIGALLLMLGGLMTFVGTIEGHLTLFEGEKKSYFTAYHDRELVIENSNTLKPIKRYPFDQLKTGEILSISELGITIEILKQCRNCAFIERTESVEHPLSPDLKGRARNFDLQPIPHEMEDEVNRSAILFKLSGSNSGKDGIHLTADFIDQSPWFQQKEQTYNISLRKERYPLPYTVELKTFKKTMHPGTDIAKSYQSEILIHQNKTLWSAMIEMNAPLRYQGYTFYQSSFLKDGERTGTVLTVVKNTGRIFPYLASFVMAIGLLLHLIIRGRSRVLKSTTAILILVGLFGLTQPTPAVASDSSAAFDFKRFSQLPVLDHGRIKPLETLAQSWLETLSGRDKIDDKSATIWLAELLFNTDHAHDLKIFRITNPALRQLLDLEERRGYRFSFNELIEKIDAHKNYWQPLFEIDRSKLSLPQKQMLELVENIDSYIELSRSLSFAHPEITINNDLLKKILELDDSQKDSFSYLELLIHKPALEKRIKKLAEKSRHIDPRKKMSADEIALINIIDQMQKIDAQPALHIFQVVYQLENKKFEWHTPWYVLMTSKISSTDMEQIKIWQDMTSAYQTGDHKKFNQAVQMLEQQTTTALKQSNQIKSLNAETILNRLKPFEISLWFYSAALVCAVFFMAGIGSRFFYPSGGFFLLVAMIAHFSGLLLRMYITGRPPVTNLYDSIVFVGLIATLVTYFCERFFSDGLYLLLGALTGTLLQSIGLKFDAEGDTLRVLAAVLDTNFWLSTHVTMITIGYSFCLLTALLAHTLLLQSALSITSLSSSKLLTHLHNMAIISLFFTATGTILGGIWADQSWGRFWGWDPKENGALLITLWLIWTLHGRYSGHLKGDIAVAAFAALSIIVAAAWFGVNLLGVGLHSYGFTENALWGFIAFCVGDLVLIGSLLVRIIYKRKYSHA